MAEKETSTAIADIVRAKSEYAPWSRHPGLVDQKQGISAVSRWSRAVSRSNAANIRVVEWYIECTVAGEKLLESSVDVDPEIRGGRAVIKGTGFTVSQVLVELADSSGVKEVADNFELNEAAIADLLNGLALLLSKPFGK